MIRNIRNFNGHSLVSHHHICNPERVGIFRRFFIAAEQRNKAFKTILEKLAAETNKHLQRSFK